MGKIYVGDVGTEIILDCGVDISNATVREIVARKPNGQVVTWAATASGTTAIKRTVLAGDLDVAGRWMLQAKVATPAWSGLGETFSIIVYNAFG